MAIEHSTLVLPGQPEPVYVIRIDGPLSAQTQELRAAVQTAAGTAFGTIYIDVRNAADMDLSATNELINAHAQLQEGGKELVLLYKNQDPVKKWVETTGIEKFMKTAIVPASA